MTAPDARSKGQGGGRAALRWAGKILLLLLVVILLLVVSIGAASELGGEVVTLTTKDTAGAEHETSLWVVEHAGHLWLRAGDPGSGWLARLQQTPEVEVTRGSVQRRYRAVPDPSARAAINELMARDYGLADSLIGFMRDGSRVVPVRLEPLAP